MKQLIIMLLIILLSTNLVYSKGSGELNDIDIAKQLIQEKKYDEAMALLSEYSISNPESIYEVQSLLDDIRVERGKINKLFDELITTIYDDEDFEKGNALVEEITKNNPYPDDLTKAFLRNAKNAAQFVINKKLFKKLMDEALVYLNNGEFDLALEKYLLCLDFHNDEFDLILEELGSPDNIQEVKLDNIDEDIPLNRYYTTLRNSSLAEVNLVKQDTEELKTYVNQLKESYNQANQIIDQESIDINLLTQTLISFKSIPDKLSALNKEKNTLIANNELFARLSTDNGSSNFLTYSTLTLTGRSEQEEGIIFVADSMFSTYIDTLIGKLEAKINNNFNKIIQLYKTDNNTSSIDLINNTKQDLVALDSIASLWKVFIKIDNNYKIIGSEILKDKYKYIGDSIVGAQVLETFNTLIAYDDEIKDKTLNLDLEGLREYIVSQLELLEVEENNWKNKLTEINNRQLIKYNMASMWATELLDNINSVKIDYLTKEVDLMDTISKNYYTTIFNTDVDNIKEDDPMLDLITNAASPTNNPENINVYFDINNTDERNLVTYNPEIALNNLITLEQEYDAFTNSLEDYISKFSSEKDYVFANVNFNKRFTSVQSSLNLALSNKQILVNYKLEAQNKITLSKESENRGNTFYENAQQSFNLERFNEAREFIESAKVVSATAISYSKNNYVINDLIPALYNLNNQINLEEARIVIRDVRELITSGKNKYLEGSYIVASDIFRAAELRWAETNIEAHPEIPYWLALIRDALAIESGRYLNVTEPLYSVLAGYLSFAEKYYREGVKEENKVNKLKSFAVADSYLTKVLEVRPLNERARFLQLQVLKSKDTEAFKVIFNNEFIKYRNDVIKAIEGLETIETPRYIPLLEQYEAIIRDSYLLNPRLSGTNKRLLLERFYLPINTSGKTQAQINKERTDNEENKKKISEAYTRFNDLLRIAENDQKAIVQRLINVSEVALGFKRLPVDTSNIRESNSIYLRALDRFNNTNQTEIDELNSILNELKRALSLNPGNDEIPVVIDEILVMLGEESNFQLSPADDKLFREAQKDFIDGNTFEARDKILIILRSNIKNKNYPKLKELIERVEIKLKVEITI